jgi:hypothetical protein
VGLTHFPDPTVSELAVSDDLSRKEPVEGELVGRALATGDFGLQGLVPDVPASIQRESRRAQK